MANLNKAERIAYIDEKLQSLYPKTPVPLDHKDPYTLLIAVLRGLDEPQALRVREVQRKGGGRAIAGVDGPW